jgi:MFS family permease
MGAEAALAGVEMVDVVLQAGHEWGDIEAITNVLVDNPYIFIGAAAGGAFGAAIGALPAFIFTGFLVLAGVAGGGAGVGVGFGPVFGPHISFAGGAAAAAYASKRGLMESGFDYHNGKDIGFALGSRPDILAVGAAFGVFGIAFEEVFRQLAVPTDPIAITVVVSAFLHRAVFGYSILGTVSSKANGFFDMGPFEREEMRGEGESLVTDGEKSTVERLAVEPWLPNMYKWSHVAAIGLAAGAFAGYAGLQFAAGGLANLMVIPAGTDLANVTVGTAVFFGFGLSAASLIFLNLGVDRIPVTHHMTLPGATAFFAVTQGGDAALAGVDPIVGLLVAAVFGMIGALIGEAGQRIFYAHGSTHVDPPAFAIFISISLIWVLAVAGVFATSVWVPGGV